jgi:hypothetical protein
VGPPPFHRGQAAPSHRHGAPAWKSRCWVGYARVGRHAGREIDIKRVWLDYDSSDPDHPPRWADFEVWPGDILFVDEEEEPDSGDVLRIFYTTDNTIDGLDSETTTTLIDRDVNILILGATGYVVQERIQEEQVYWGKRDWRDWAAARLQEFEDALARIAHKQAIKHSGIAETGDLDRWDADWA